MLWLEKKLNKYGYLVERFTITRNNKTLSSPEKLFWLNKVKPEPLVSWEAIIDTNENAHYSSSTLW
jgi:hypothetical protein